MDKRNDYYTDWDDGVYGTGPTEPPKNRGGLVALMLIAIIFLCGIITVLGILNIQLFRQLKTQEENELSISVTTPVETKGETLPLEEEGISALQLEPVETAPIELHQSPASIDNIPQEGGLSLQEIYTANLPSVVSISATASGGNGTGTGVILTRDGYVVTNAHVVEDAISVSVLLSDEQSYSAKIVGLDVVTDLAVLRIEANDLIPAQFGDSTQLRIGDTVVAIGDPLGVKFRATYTDGIISGIDRDVEVDGRIMTLLQTNAALNSGNSGGPLINCYGQVIGINTMKIGAFADTAGVEGLGFAVPSTTVKDVVEQIIAQGYVSGRPTLGIEGETLATFYQYYYHMPAGLYITQLSRASDAYKKGVEPGDILMSINDVPITTMEELNAAIYGLEVGETVEAVIFRSGTNYLLELVVTEDKQ